MKLFRYRKPSIKRMVGVTRAKKAVRKATGLNTIARNTNPSRIKQRIKQRVGLYSPTMRTIRQTAEGKIPMPMMPEVSLTGSRKKSTVRSEQNRSRYEVEAKSPEELKCPRCGQLFGAPVTGYRGGFFSKKAYQYFWCKGCNSKFDISHMEGTWKCDFCSEEFSSKEACEEHEKTHSN